MDVVIYTNFPMGDATSVYVDGKPLLNVLGVGIGQAAGDEGYDLTIETKGDPEYDDQLGRDSSEVDYSAEIIFSKNPEDTRVNASDDFLNNIAGIRFSHHLQAGKLFEMLFCVDTHVKFVIKDAVIQWKINHSNTIATKVETEYTDFDEEE